jgi:hypothetical protein
MRNLALAILAALALSGCGSSSTGGGPGAESFTSQPPGGSAGTTAGGATGTPSTPTTAPGTTPAPDAAARAVEESDVYKLVGTTLYVLNAYRGLQVVDLASLDAPALRARVAVTGRPVDLYVRDGVAHFAVSDLLAWHWAAEAGAARPSTGSQVWAVDVSRPAEPVVLARLDVEGSVTDTRRVGDVLLVVSRRSSWQDVMVLPGGAVGTSTTTLGDAVLVTSFDLSIPSAPRAVDRVELDVTGWETHAHVDDGRITLSQSGWSAAGPTTRFTFVDVSDPGGALRTGASFEAPGRIPDRWAMDRDAAGGTFRAVLQDGWNAGATLRTWTSATPSAVAPLGVLELRIAETLTAARFDGTRAYVVTAERVDPLWVVDLADPARPQLAGQLHMPGQIEFVEPRGARLLALGHTNEAGQPWQLAVSLLDVSVPSAPALLGRVLVGTGAGSVNASPDDMRKAFQVLDADGLVLVPYQGWDGTSWRWVGGLQLVDLDLAAGRLTARGFVPHRGAITRAFPAPGRAAWLATLSDERLQLVDATDRAAPVERAGLDLARPVTELAFVGGRAVELSGDWWRGDTALVVAPATDPDAAVPLARLELAAPQARMFRDGSVVWLLASDGSQGRCWLEAVDLADPLHPVRRGRLELDLSEAPSSPGWGWWGAGDEAVLSGHVLAVHRAWFGPLVAGGGGVPMPLLSGVQADADAVVLYDLSDPDAPRRAGRVVVPGSSWSWGLRAEEGFLWLTHHQWTSDRHDEVRYHVDRIDVSVPDAPVLLPPVNVPGILVGAGRAGTRIYTLETAWSAAGPSSATLHALDLTDRGTARLAASVPLPGWPSGALLGGGFAYAVTQGTGAGQRLAAVDLSAMRLASEQALESSWSWPLRATGGRLFLTASSASGSVVLVYGLGDPGRPALEQAVPTQGWAWDVVVEGGVAYLPGGAYGVAMIPLGAGP